MVSVASYDSKEGPSGTGVALGSALHRGLISAEDRNRFLYPESCVGPRALSILGATGSIGRSALELVRRYPGKLAVRALTGARNLVLLEQQVREFRPEVAVVADSTLDGSAEFLSLRAAAAAVGTEIFVGPEALCRPEIVGEGVDIVLAAIVGIHGILPVLAALRAGRTVALANKESIVAGAPLLRDALQAAGESSSGRGRIVPVDSEHSALFQLLVHSNTDDVDRLVLTASGGPFLKTPLADLTTVTPEQAVRHPRWSMGRKISVDSATLVNKALELIEACALFGVGPERVEVVIHPQSIIHGMVVLRCGALLAHLSVPDMQHPIAYAILGGERVPGVVPFVDLVREGSLQFEAVDNVRFPAVTLARECVVKGGNHTAVFTVANDCVVERFLLGGCSFLEIVPTIERIVERFGSGAELRTPEELFDLEERVRGVLGDVVMSG